MPSVIPYDPSLVLGNLVPLDKLANLQAISAAQAPADAAEDELNSLISLRRSMDMTIQELINMGIEPGDDLLKESQDTGKTIRDAAVAYTKAKIEAVKAIKSLKTKSIIDVEVESPIDYNRSDIKKMPLSADSMRMNVQYFSVDQNQQNSSTHAATVSSFVSGEVSFFGDSFSSQVSGTVSNQVNSQNAKHEIAGTLVIAVTCTHKDAVLFAPFIIDVDKGIRAWNRIYPDAMIKTDSLTNISKIASEASTPSEKSLTLLSGATYGSCFVGMVHVLNTTSTESNEEMYSLASKMQSQFKVAGWFEDASGGFGVSDSFSNDAKNLLSTQNVSAHCSLVTMGSIPSIKSNSVAMGVQSFADDDGSKSMAALMKLQNATATAQDSVDASSAAARTGKQMVVMQNSKIDAALSALAKIDDGQNKIIDTNSMMDALDDYIQKALAGNLGVPINYYLKPVTRSQLAQMWMAKYFPGKYLAISGDDSQPATGGGGGNTGGGN
jgi:hypothetical protein